MRQLGRQIGSQFYERTALSRTKAAMLAKSAAPKPEVSSHRTMQSRIRTCVLTGGGAAWAKASGARGHCGKIGNIYDQHLNPWFKRVTKLDETERKALKQLFKELRNTDNAMVDLIEKSAMWLADSARQVLDHFEKGEMEKANETIASARMQILPVRRSLMQTLASIRELEADFIGMSGVA